jgi:hypothetical protein
MDIDCHDQPGLHGSACSGYSTVDHLEADLLRPAVVVGGDRPCPYPYHRIYLHGHCSAYCHLAKTSVGVRGDERGIAIGRRSYRMMIWNRGYHCGCGCGCDRAGSCRAHVAIVGDVVVIASSPVRRAASLPCPRGFSWLLPALHLPLLFECSPAHRPSAYPDKTSSTIHIRCTL